MRLQLIGSVCSLVVAFSGSMNAAPITMTVSAPSAAPPHDQVSVTIGIAGLGTGTAQSIGTFDVNLGFDPLLLSFVSATFGNQLDILGLGDIRTVTLGVGVVNLFELSLDSPAELNRLQLPAFTLATLTFDTLAEGRSPLTVTVNALGDADGSAVEAQIQNGSILIQNSVPEPRATPIVAGVLVAILLASRRIRTASDRSIKSDRYIMTGAFGR